MDTPVSGETVTPTSAPTNVATTPPAPQPVVKPEDTAVEELKKQLAQQEMRANQLANQLKAKEEADAQAKAKELEEQSQFKELFEQEKAKREALEQETETKEKQAALTKATQETLSGFSDQVRKLAEETGLTLLDTDEKAVEAFKGKLEKIATMVGEKAKITPNNPGQQNNSVELTTDQLRNTLQDDNAFHDLVVKKFPGIAHMTKAGK